MKDLVRLKTDESGDCGVVILGCELQDTGATFSDEITFGEWAEVGRKLSAISGASLWWLADWFIQGDKMAQAEVKKTKRKDMGEKYRKMLELIDFRLGTLKQIAWVGRKIARSSRLDLNSLSFWHHAEVAVLEREEQEKHLALAVAKKWSRADLREAVRKAHMEIPTEPPIALGFMTTKWVNEGLRWFRSEASRRPIKQWDVRVRQALRKELEPLVEIYREIDATLR